MQKLLLTTVSAIALGVCATAALASGSATYTNQSGDNQTANIDQSGGNYDQVGTSGAAFVQNDGGGSGGNTITITQTGTYNTFGVSAQSFQSGTTNAAIVNQAGYNSSVVLQQTGANNGAAADAAFWTNSAYGGVIGQDNTSNSSSVFLAQSGSDNIFDIGQGGYNNWLTATQIGTDQLYIRQGTTAFPVFNSAFNTSYGSDSTITVYQNGGGTYASTNYASLAQGGGNWNQITVTQIGSVLGADVNQNGSNNIFSSNQAGSGNMVGLAAGWAADTPVTQTGTGNQYWNTQVGTNATANGSQYGTNNYVSNYQAGNLNTISGSQINYGNQVYSSQWGSKNSLVYAQSGSSNYILNNQYGALAVASVTQTGDSNQSYGWQDGAGPNTATVTQTGNSNLAAYSQNGSGNSVSIKQ